MHRSYSLLFEGKNKTPSGYESKMDFSKSVRSNKISKAKVKYKNVSPVYGSSNKIKDFSKEEKTGESFRSSNRANRRMQNSVTARSAVIMKRFQGEM